MELEKESLNDIFKECKKKQVKLTFKEVVCLLMYLYMKKRGYIEKLV